jgi:Na+/melibiose symporter-like transporter
MNTSRWGRLLHWPRSRDIFDSTGMSSSLRRSLYLVILAATFGNACGVITTGAAWTGFLREVVHADDFALGIISAIPVIANTSQLFISFIMERRRNRRFMLLFFGIIGRALWIFIGLIPFLIPESRQYLRPMTVIVLVALIAGGNSAVNLAFNSLMGDLVPLRIRGRYFSGRYRMFVMAGIAAGLLTSWIMDTQGMLGYTIVLVLAGILGVMDLSCFFFVEWPAMRTPPPEEKQESFLSMIHTVLRDKPYMMLVLFYTAWNFAVGVSTPFFNVHMLENLHMNYTLITLSNQITSNVMAVLFVSRWGGLIDRHGNKPILNISVLVCMLTPLLWIPIQPGMVWLVVVVNIMGGIFWAPIDLGQQNLSLNLAGEKNQSMYLAVYFTVVNLAGVALGNTVGGMLVQGVFAHLERLQVRFLWLPMNRYQYVFLASAILRILTVVFILPLIREVGSKALRPVMREITTNSAAGIKRRLPAKKWHMRNKIDEE